MCLNTAVSFFSLYRVNIRYIQIKVDNFVYEIETADIVGRKTS